MKPENALALLLLRRSAVRILLAAAAILILPTAAAAFSMPAVQLQHTVEVNRDPITLGDIATVAASDPETQERLEAVVVGKAPLAGGRRRLSLDYIQLRLRQSRINPSQVRLEGPEVIEVHRGSMHIPADEIEMMVRDFLAANPPAQGDDVVVAGVDVPQEGVVIPKGDLNYDIDYLNQSRFSGTQPLYVHFRVDGLPVKRVFATVRMEIMQDVLVTRYGVSRGRILGPDDVVVQRMNIAGLPSDLFTRVEDIVGKQAKRRIGARTAVRSAWVEQPPAVDKGDRVLLLAEQGELRITALGEVKRKGRIGERIPVLNLDSNKSVFGRLVDARTVKVEF